MFLNRNLYNNITICDIIGLIKNREVFLWELEKRLIQL